LVANPGCYPTATLLALGPLLRAGLVEGPFVVDAKSGVSGAGRQASEEASFGETADDVRAYKILRHPHGREIATALGRLSGSQAAVTFTAHLLPLRRGLLATCYARPRLGVKEADLASCLEAAYENAPFVRVVPPDRVALKAVAGTNLAYVGVAADAGMVVAFGAIDNLVKGAAGQAVQNMNALFGLDGTAGLLHMARFAP
jgi:N-acetyl-gamma-glutamyl-phosphate reductase